MSKLRSWDLTLLAEALGKRCPPPVRYLSALARHADPVVREGVVYGAAFALARSNEARALLERIAGNDQDDIVRTCAREALEE